MYVEHFNSSVISATSMFKLSVTSHWALMAARGWARLILDHRRYMINERPPEPAALLRQKPPSTEPWSATTSTTPLTTHAVPFTTAKQDSSFVLPYSQAYSALSTFSKKS